MKLFKLIILFWAGVLTVCSAAGQNASLNLLTQNGGVVNVGGQVFLQVTVAASTGTGGQITPISTYRVRAQISVPSAIVTIPATGHSLPSGWSIVSNDGANIIVCNGTNTIPVGQSRTILIAMEGTAAGGPSTITGSLTFGNGNPATGCTTTFGSLAGNNTADDGSNTSVTVSVTTPVSLTDFTAKLVNCQPVLHWISEGEINFDRFEIEKASLNNSSWMSIGVVAANGNTTTKSEYNFIDRNLTASPEQVLYRLKMVDKNGRYKYSGILRVYINCKNTQVYVYPNPVQDGKLYVSLTGVSDNTVATLQSLSGQVLSKNKINIGTTSLNVSNLSDGVYVLHIKDANGLDKKIKIFIQH